MPHTSGMRTMLAVCLLPGALVLTTGCEKDKLSGPKAEVRQADVKLNLPAVPDFALPTTEGGHSVKELRVKGKKLLETDVTVKGVVTWAYDCPTAVRQPGMDDKAVQKLIDEDPTRCQRAKFYIGDSADTPPEKSLWIVDVPRPYNKLEIERIKKPDRNLQMYPDRCEPGEKDPAKNVCPPYKVGDQVEITGKFAVASPHSERNSDGLLVYKKMKNITQSWESPMVEPAPDGAAAGGGAPAGGRLSPEDLVKQNKK
ncbi:MAG TPA: hypothetical protein VM513_27110 [Kofleriaceae bacterium]|nr:hypothetical protein [Kofleriaceae bacterium]